MESLQEKARQEYPDRSQFDVQSNKKLPEAASKRRPDAVVVTTDDPPKAVKIYEAGRTNKSGAPVARERRKLQEYERLGIPSEFHPVK